MGIGKILSDDEIHTCVNYATYIDRIRDNEDRLTKLATVIAAVEHMKKILSQAVVAVGDCVDDGNGFCAVHSLNREPMETCWVSRAKEVVKNA